MNLKVGGAHTISSLTVFFAERIKCANTAFVTSSPRFDTLANPHLFLGETLVEERALVRFHAQSLGLTNQVFVVRAGPARQTTTIELDDARGNTTDEGTVMADEQHRTAIGLQKLLEPQDGFDIEVVGRLVEQ